jgi:hypothetical protein
MSFFGTLVVFQIERPTVVIEITTGNCFSSNKIAAEKPQLRLDEILDEIFA